MALWERYDTQSIVTAVGDHTVSNVLLNEEDTDNFQNADLAIVDGIVTVITNSDDLVGVRLLLTDEIVDINDINEGDPEPGNRMVWYTWFCARGPLIFRLRSKRLLHPHHFLRMNIWKARGTTATTVNVGMNFLLQLKH